MPTQHTPKVGDVYISKQRDHDCLPMRVVGVSENTVRLMAARKIRSHAGRRMLKIGLDHLNTRFTQLSDG